MRIFGALVFAVLATAGLLTLPWWSASEPIDVGGLVPAQERALTEQFVDAVRTHHAAAAAAMMTDAGRPRDNGIFGRIAELFPAEHWQHLRVQNWTSFVSTQTQFHQGEMYFDYHDGGALRLIVKIVPGRRGPQIESVNFNYFSAAAVHANDFRPPSGPTDIRWVFLAIAAAADVFAFATFALCLITPVVRWRWRWLWLLVVLAGVLRFNLDWVTLTSAYQLVSTLLPPAGFYRFVSYGSWVLSISLPVGAMIYWAKRVQWRNEDAAADMRMP